MQVLVLFDAASETAPTPNFQKQCLVEDPKLCSRLWTVLRGPEDQKYSGAVREASSWKLEQDGE